MSIDKYILKVLKDTQKYKLHQVIRKIKLQFRYCKSERRHANMGACYIYDCSRGKKINQLNGYRTF